MIASSQVFGRAFEAPQQLPALYAAYRTLFDQSEELFVVKPENPSRPGPELRIYRLKPPPPATPPAP